MLLLSQRIGGSEPEAKTCCWSGFGWRDLAQEVPNEPSQFTCERDVDLRFHHAAVQQVPAAFVQTRLHFPTEFTIRGGLTALAQRKGRGHLGGRYACWIASIRIQRACALPAFVIPASLRLSALVDSLGTSPRKAMR